MNKIDIYTFLNSVFNITMAETELHSSTSTSGYSTALEYMEPYLKLLHHKSEFYIKSFKKYFCREFVSSYAEAIETLTEEPLSSYVDLWISFAKTANTIACMYATNEEQYVELVAKQDLSIPIEVLTSMNKHLLEFQYNSYKVAKTAQDQAHRQFREASSSFYMHNHESTKNTYYEIYSESMKEANNTIAKIMIQSLPFDAWYEHKSLLEAHPCAILKYESIVFKDV
jgi:hypothetical protein